MIKFYFLVLFTFFITTSFAQIQPGGSDINSCSDEETKGCCKKYLTSGNETVNDDLLQCVGSTKTSYIQRNGTNQLSLVTNQQTAATGTLMMHNIYGQLIVSKNINLLMGPNNIELPSSNTPQMRIVSFFVGKQLMFIQKVY